MWFWKVIVDCCRFSLIANGENFLWQKNEQIDHENAAISLMWYFGQLFDGENTSGDNPSRENLKGENPYKSKNTIIKSACLYNMQICVNRNNN